MRFILVEDKTLTLSDDDYKKVSDYMKQQNIEAKNVGNRKDTNAFDEFNKNTPIKHKIEFIKEINEKLVSNYKNEDLVNAYYNLLASNTTNQTMKELIQKYTSRFTDKPQALDVCSKLVNNTKLNSETLRRIMKDNNFWTESDDDIAWKIKAVTAISDKDFRNRWIGINDKGKTSSISEIMLTKSGSSIKEDNVVYLSRAKMEKKLNGFQQRSDNKVVADAAKAKEQEKQEKEQQIDAEKGPTGKKLIAQILQADGKEYNKQNIYDYVKTLTNKTKMKAIADGIIETGDFDRDLNKLLKDRYISELGDKPIDDLNREIIGKLDSLVNKVGSSK